MGVAELFCRALQFLAANYALCRRGRFERLTNSTNAHRGQKGDHYARPNQISQNKLAGRVAERHRLESVVRELVVDPGATPRGRWRRIADVARQRPRRPERSTGASSPPSDANP